MMRGRKSKYGAIATSLLVACCAALAIFAPASVFAAGDCEYCVELPNGGGGGDDPTAQSSGGGGADQPDASTDSSSSAGAGDTTATTPTEPTDDGSSDGGDSDQGGAAGGKDNNGGGGGGGKADVANGEGALGDSLSGTSSAEASPASTSDDSGGISPFLIAVAIIAAVCAGLAIWRLRGRLNLGGSRPETNPGA